MNPLTNLTTYSASEARDNLYTLIKTASKGLRGYEIQLRGSDPVVLVNKAELESWVETFDILQNPEETDAIRMARTEKKTISHAVMLKSIGLNHEN